MENTFEEIRRQIHDIRNCLAPFDLKLAGLDHRIAEMRLSIDKRLGGFESKLIASALRVEEHGLKLEDLWARVNWIELTLNIPPRPKPTRESARPPENKNPENPGLEA